MQIEFARHIFEKRSSISCHENPSNGSRGVPCERTDRQTKIIVAFRNFAEAPENCTAFYALFDVLTATTLKYSCLITAATVTVLTVRNVDRY